MKIKNKGKVHPSIHSSSSSSVSAASNGIVLSVLELLPVAIFALATGLSVEDREVLAYLITTSMKTTPNFTSIPQEPTKNKSLKKGSSKSAAAGGAHQPPMFDCSCFDCYISYWSKWNSSFNRELIHQAIDAFEDHLAHGEKPKKSAGRSKRRDKQLSRREPPNTADVSAQDSIFLEQSALPELTENSAAHFSENEVVSVSSPGKNDGFEATPAKVEGFGVEVKVEPPQTADDVAMIVRTTAANSHRGLARKVLPDVLGLLNSRLWNLWSPNV